MSSTDMLANWHLESNFVQRTKVDVIWCTEYFMHICCQTPIIELVQKCFHKRLSIALSTGTGKHL